MTISARNICLCLEVADDLTCAQINNNLQQNSVHLGLSAMVRLEVIYPYLQALDDRVPSQPTMVCL